MHALWTIALIMLGSQLVVASTSNDNSCGTCDAGYICQAGTCVLDTARLTGNPLPTITSDNPGGPIKTTGLSASAESTSTGEAKTTSAATAGATTSTEAKSTSIAESHSSSASKTSQASSSAAASSSSAVAAASTSSGAASSLAMVDSRVVLGVAWAIGLPLVA